MWILYNHHGNTYPHLTHHLPSICFYRSTGYDGLVIGVTWRRLIIFDPPTHTLLHFNNVLLTLSMYSYFYRKICSRVEEVVNTAYSGIPYPTTERIVLFIGLCSVSCMAGSRARLRPLGGGLHARWWWYPTPAVVSDTIVVQLLWNCYYRTSSRVVAGTAWFSVIVIIWYGTNNTTCCSYETKTERLWSTYISILINNIYIYYIFI